MGEAGIDAAGNVTRPTSDATGAMDRRRMRDLVFSDAGAKQRLLAVYPRLAEIHLRPAGLGKPGIERGVDIERITVMEATQLFWHASTNAEPSGEEQTLLRRGVAHAETMPA